MHEATHILHEHIPRAIELREAHAKEEVSRYIFDVTCNIAMDMAANAVLRQQGFLNQDGRIGIHKQIRVYLPEHAELPDLFSYEHYQKALLRSNHMAEALVDASVPLDPAAPSGVPDVFRRLAVQFGYRAFSKHVFSDFQASQIGPAVTKIYKKQLQRIVRGAKEAHKKQRGTLPGYYEEAFNVPEKEPEAPWNYMLRAAVGHQLALKTQVSMARPVVRRWGEFRRNRVLPYPGNESVYKCRVYFIIDTSGSMGPPELKDAIGEVMGIARRTDLAIELWVVEADTAVRKIYLVKDENEINPEFLGGRESILGGRGGTDFNEPLRKAVEGEADCVIYYTDGGAPPPANPLRVPLFWLISPSGVNPGLPGQVFYMGDHQ